MTRGAVGYVGYDCVKYFEPKTRRPLKDILKVPESLFMLYDTIVVLDHFFQKVMVVTYVKVPESLDNLDAAYDEAKQTVNRMLQVLKKTEAVLPTQEPVKLRSQSVLIKSVR
jgi:anthranilate synthase component 1